MQGDLAGGARSIVCFVALLWPTLTFSQLQVVRTHPSSQAVIAGERLQISVEFSESIEPATIDGKSFAVFGRWSGVCPGVFTFDDNNKLVTFNAQKSISSGEWVTVSLAKSIASAAGNARAQGYAWNFWTVSKQGSFEFVKTATIPVRKPGEGRIRTYGAYAGDLNGDGYHDFTVPNEDASDIRVFLNDGNGGYSDFTEYSLPANSRPSTNEGADFNGDGHLDFACGNIIGGSVSVFFGDGTGLLSSPVSYQTAAQVRGLTVLDLDGDGDTDIISANRAGDNISSLLNNGDGTFDKVMQHETNISGETACAASDFNEDGLLDVVVAGYTNGMGLGEIVVMLNDGQGGFSHGPAQKAGGDCWMLAVGDLDADGNVDVVSANSHQDQLALLRGDGHGGLASPELYDVGGFPLAIDLGDIDGDGDLDVITSNFSSADWSIYENDGSGHLINLRTLPTTSAGSCAVLHDRDLDGDLDLTAIDELDDTILLFENPAISTSVSAGPEISGFELKDSYPNPYNANAAAALSIPFLLEKSGVVKVEFVNIRGQKIAADIVRHFSSGAHKFYFSPQQHGLHAGIYFYRVNFNGKWQAGRFILTE